MITNSSNDDETGISFNYHKYSSSRPTGEEAPPARLENYKITSNNLEIRKLQVNDAGWYECQLPTKPTQINYVYLEVLGAPKIEASSKHLKAGDVIELTCQVKHLPSGYELQWSLNDKKIHANVFNKTSQHKTERRNHSKNFKNLSEISQTRSKRNANRSFVIYNDKINNYTISKLRISNLNEQLHKGVYKCKYDKLEAKFHLDLKPKGRNFYLK